MGDDLRRQIYLSFNHRQTEELSEIWRAHDCNEWSKTTFDVIREILQERQVDPPPIGQPADETQNKARQSKPGMMPGDPQAQHLEPRPQRETTRPAVGRGVESARPQTAIYAVYLAAWVLAIQEALAAVNLVTG